MLICLTGQCFKPTADLILQSADVNPNCAGKFISDPSPFNKIFKIPCPFNEILGLLVPLI